MAELTGKGLADHCRAKLGTPYVYGAKGSYGKLTQPHLNSLILAYPDIFTNIYITKAKRYVGQVCTDCSGLISWYTGKVIGSYQMYKSATKKEPIKTIGQAPVGATLWRSGHVGVKVDDTYCIEAKGINYGTVKTKIKDTSFTHWLLFEDIMSYDCESVKTPVKLSNPYKEPTTTIFKGCKGEEVKWVQWELRDAGITEVEINGVVKELKIDGDCGPITDRAIRMYQQSCKFNVDGRVGPVTRTELKAA